MSNNNLKYIPGLDLLRFAAALLVMMFHFLYLPWATQNNLATAAVMAGGMMDFSAVWPIAWQGWIGVQIFFVISGIVIAASAEGRNSTDFARSRIVRLLPAIFICATLSLLTGFITPIHETPELLKLYGGTLLIFPHGLNAVYWTLRIEIIFYLLVFLLLWRGKLSWLEPATIGLTIANAIFWALYFYVPDHHIVKFLHKGGILRELWFHYGCFFAIGIFMWKGLNKKRLVWFVIAAISCIAQIIDFATPFQTPSSNIITPIVVWLISLMLMQLSLNMRKIAVNTPVLHSVRLLGLATYPLYLLHDFSGVVLMGKLYNLGISAFAAASIAMLACIIAALLIARFFEPPLANALRRLISRRHAPA